MEPIRVVIADDQHLFAEGLKHVLQGASAGGIQVVGTASNGAEAVELATRHDPDLILMDIRMPEMDGVEATEIIHREHPEVKILVLTTFDDDDLAYRALQCGANGFVLKNIEPEDLVQAVQAVKRGVLYVSPSVGFRLLDNMRSSVAQKVDSQDNLVARISARIPSLTLREAEVLAHVVRADRNQEIAERLFISEKTVKNHISNIYDKLGIHNRLKLIAYVSEIGVLQKSQ
jgi:DNA-binding NarL/FixJ family response regulator